MNNGPNVTSSDCEHSSNLPEDCGCGCGGAGDCQDENTPGDRARRSFLLGGGTVVVSTLVNHRAFAQGAACGPISAAGSPTASTTNITSQCGGLTPGFWSQHQDLSAAALGFSESSQNPAYLTHLKNFLSGKKLGSVLSNLNSIDPTSAGKSFCQAFLAPHDPAFHWAGAILCALTPGMNPNYGYTIGTLNQAIQQAHKNNVSLSAMIAAIGKLENDYNVSNSSSNACTVC
jgi:hypothetical protein